MKKVLYVNFKINNLIKINIHLYKSNQKKTPIHSDKILTHFQIFFQKYYFTIFIRINTI